MMNAHPTPISALSILLLTGLIALCSVRRCTAQDERLLTDFADDDGGLIWTSVNDTVMGGRSKGVFEIRDGRIEFRGELNTNGGGFTSIRTRPTEFDLGDFAGFRLRVRGDGREYNMRVRQSGERGWRQPAYGTGFRTVDLQGTDRWQEVIVPFDWMMPTWRGQKLDIPGVDPTRIESLGITLADYVDGPFALDVDWIEAFKAQSVESLKGTRRVIALFANSNADLELLRQWQALKAESAALEGRDLAIAVLVPDGRSSLGDRPLAAAEAKAFCDRYEVAVDRFTAVLIGRDGGAKAREQGVFEPRLWLDLVDTMPMRRAELKEQENSAVSEQSAPEDRTDHDGL